MKTYIATYTEAYNIFADSEEDAIDRAQFYLADESTWQAKIDHHDSDNFNSLGEK